MDRPVGWAVPTSETGNGVGVTSGGHSPPYGEFWRTLDELDGTPEFQQWLQREFPEDADRWTDLASRRDFLKLMAASLALAGMPGCVGKQPEEDIVPYVRQPEELVPGRPLYYATAMELSGVALRLLVESHMGRPTKIEGNPTDPADPQVEIEPDEAVHTGPTNVYAQAAVLSLYDPDRSQTLLDRGAIVPWGRFVTWARARMEAFEENGGRGLRILSPPVISPTLSAQMDELLAAYPNARWHQYEPINRDNARAGAILAFGRDVQPLYHVERAARIVSLDHELLDTLHGRLRDAHSFMERRRRGIEQPETELMNRLYVVESSMTTTGAKADHRLPLRPELVATYARALASVVGVGGDGVAPASLPTEITRKWIDEPGKDLVEHRGACLVVAGEAQPPLVHALAHAMNHALDSVGEDKPVQYIQPLAAQPVDHVESLRALVDDIRSGDEERQVELLVIL
ncbi:MAG: TAT-variant-translocated molybdopterin oxidoreductase, partial [Planctomycetes bacterium]|nr:TAT-variant-translocated molybdopterin oxidoreductase [Planctomycetota bacterium]